ncbi:hypothetical protein KK083_05980 [Fulvivirgaceae bacterium PWU4]|uniref:DUF4848 domain-containing protein n=1 Tax=Chryseosolibacter histidini TaxID=2782349 RepID=A0AAP2GN13_9BACT|nr:hypothetical protein [Chryseosolibacter histidini]MBT1696415.1 hypothetical protein [Chryseosolibacter histidini]
MIKKILYVAVIATATASCSEPVAPTAHRDVSVVDGRLVFRDNESFNNLLDGLQSANAAEVIQKLNGFDYVSLEQTVSPLYGSKDMPVTLQRYNDQLPQVYRRLLNSEGIIQIGDDVIKFLDGIKYYQNVNEFGKAEITSSKNIGHYGMKSLESASGNSGRKVSGWLNGTLDYGGDQYEFLLGDYSRRKYVNEWNVSYETGAHAIGSCDPYSTTVKLWTKIKLEGRPNLHTSWVLAPEARTVSWSLQISNAYVYYYKGCNGDTNNPNTHYFTNYNTGGSRVYTTNDPGTGSHEFYTLSFTDDMDWPFAFDKGILQACVVGSITQDYTNLPAGNIARNKKFTYDTFCN